MRILFCSPTPLVAELGAAKVLVELSEAMEKLGWQCRLIDPSDLLGEGLPKNQPKPKLESFITHYSQNLRTYLQQHAAEYDVVDYNHVYLPYSRAEFAPDTLLVARSVLLAHYLETIPLPQAKSWKSQVRSWLKGKAEQAERRKIIEFANRTIQAADVVNVSNPDDKAALVAQGVPSEKLVVLPFGISAQRRPAFESISSAVPPEPIVAFIGTFDNRKGATDFPAILTKISQEIPNVRFRLLGTARAVTHVLADFPKWLTPQIEVIPYYAADELPQLLAACSVGIFPSYYEGFGFGVLEMLAASIPVIAYGAPGPPMMLPPEYLVSPGDTHSMSNKVVNLLNHPDQLTQARIWAKQQSYQFCWDEIAKQTSQVYSEYCQQRRHLTH